MRYLLDEMLDREIAAQLRMRGLDAIAVTGRDELRGLADAEILAWAWRNRRAVVTSNTRDFARLHQEVLGRGEHHAGVLLGSSRSFPRGKASIGLWVGAIEGHEHLMGETAGLQDLCTWLHPAAVRRG